MANDLAVCHGCMVASETALIITIESADGCRGVSGWYADRKVLRLVPYSAEKTREHFLEKFQQHSTIFIDSSSTITSRSFDWIAACKRGEVTALNTFIVHHCSDFKKFFQDENDTPLHHIQLKSFREYQEFLANPLFNEMVNAPDFEHSTPLHRALERQDIMFVEALITSDLVDLCVKDANGKAATDLLADLCTQSYQWDAMCKRTGIDTLLKTPYSQPMRAAPRGHKTAHSSGASVSQMRETLVVVAALLSTLTFAAAFTLPGGYNTTGDAILAKKASFIVFIIADAYAMCTAMLVLFCLVATVAGDHVEAMKRVKRTKFIIIQSLYGTLVAFAAAVFTVIADKSLWSAIVIFVMCSLVAISANNPVVCDLLDKFFPIADVEGIDESETSSRHKKKKYQTRRLKRGLQAATGANADMV